MPTLGFLVQPAIAPAASRAVDRALLARAIARGRGTLRIATFEGDVLSLGRHHPAPGGAAGVVLHRRLSGGRVAAAGAGFVHLSLALPHRSALVSDAPSALAPEQVLNRAVRGLLGGLELAGIPALYPGRDLVTVRGLPIAALGLEVEDGGATLVEAVLSVARDQSALPGLLERADPAGVVTAPLLSPDDVTSVGRETGRTPALDAVSTWCREGFARRLGVAFADEPAVAGLPDPEADFVGGRTGHGLDRRCRIATMLGVLEVHAARTADGRLGTVVLAGDILAPSGTMRRLEDGLRGCPGDVASVRAVVEGVLRGGPDDFVLGVRPDALIDAVVRAAA